MSPTGSHDQLPALSFGEIVGLGPTAGTWLECIRPIDAQVVPLRDHVESAVRLNIVFMIPGPGVPVDFSGIRLGRYSRTRRALMIQVSLDHNAGAPSAEAIVRLVRDAVEMAEGFARRKRIADGLPELRAIADRLQVNE